MGIRSPGIFFLIISFSIYGAEPDAKHCKSVPAKVRAQFPTTGRVSHDGFADFLKTNLGHPRQNIKLFTDELRAKFGPEFLTLVNSGSSANMVAATAIKETVGVGHIIAAGFTFPTTLSPFLLTGFNVSLVDVRRDDFTIDPAAIERAIRPDTKAIIVTHFLGFPADMKRILAIAKEKNLLILQDSCEAMKLEIDGKQAYEYGDFTTWSFYHPHHLSAYGGGAIISNSKTNLRLIESIAHWGRACSCHVDELSCSAPAGMDHNFGTKDWASMLSSAN